MRRADFRATLALAVMAGLFLAWMIPRQAPELDWPLVPARYAEDVLSRPTTFPSPINLARGPLEAPCFTPGLFRTQSVLQHIALCDEDLFEFVYAGPVRRTDYSTFLSVVEEQRWWSTLWDYRFDSDDDIWTALDHTPSLVAVLPDTSNPDIATTQASVPRAAAAFTPGGPQVAAVPLPGALGFLGVGLLSLTALSRRRRR